MSELKIGDIVRLKGNGPILTVTGTAAGEQVRCAWFTPAHEARSEVYPRGALLHIATQNDDGSFQLTEVLQREAESVSRGAVQRSGTGVLS